MKLLLVGSVPPPTTVFSEALVHLGARALESGSQVDVLSPDPRSAARLHGSLGGLRLAFQLAVRSRHYDALVLRIEQGLPLRAKVGRVERTVTLSALGLALGRWSDVTIRLDSPVPIPRGVGGRATNGLWRNAKRIVVANAADRRELLLVPGISESVVEVEEVAGVPRPPDPGPWSGLGEEPTREAVLALVRVKALSKESIKAAREELAYAGDAPFNSTIFDSASARRVRPIGKVRLVVEGAKFLRSRLR